MTIRVAVRGQPLTLQDFQRLQAAWLSRQPFKNGPSWHPLLGIVEEVGELAHAHLKQAQGIRGTAAEHTVKKKDAVGDVLVYLADYCSREGFNMQRILEDVWSEVMERDWADNPATGKSPVPPWAVTPKINNHVTHTRVFGLDLGHVTIADSQPGVDLPIQD